MTKTKSTKRALLMSALALVMCFSMLIGSTFAWFTDSVTSGNNKIVAGTLDVDLLMADATGNYASIAGENAAIFGEGSLAQNNAQETLWEPGKTQIVYLAVANDGNLDLKYNIALNVVDGGLIGSLEYAIIDDTKYGEISATDWAAIKANANAQTSDVVAGTIVAAPNGAIKADEDADYFALAVHMKEEADNEYQGKDITIDVTVLATQLASESDSFNNQYDKEAKFYDVATAAELQEAINNAVPGTTIQLAPGVNYGTVVFGRNASSEVVDISYIGGDESGNERYSRYENITILGAAGATVDQITFDNGREDVDTIWNYIDVKNLTIKNVTFSGASTAVMIPDGFAIAIDGLSLVNCKMTDTEGNDRFVYQPHTGYEIMNDKTTGNYVMTSGVKNLTITGCEVVGAHQVLEARPMEGITITNNVFKNSALHDILLAGSGYDYTGITITGNTSDGAGDRFVRATSIGNGTVTVTGNTVTNNAKTDPIKVDGVTGGNTNVTVQTTW